MVKETERADGVGRIRPLNVPQLIDVRADERGWHMAVRIGGRWLTGQVVDRWRIDHEWWREREVVRAYYLLLLESGGRTTVYKDLVSGKWWRQEYH